MVLLKSLTLSGINEGNSGYAAEASSPEFAFIGSSRFCHGSDPHPCIISLTSTSPGQASTRAVGDMARSRMFASSSSSPSPSASSSRKSYNYSNNKTGVKRTQQKQHQEQSTTNSNNRNRGANAADHNRRGHSFRLGNKEISSDGADAGADAVIKRRPINTKRPPRWEREGDKLYAEVTKELDSLYDHGISSDDDGDDDDGDEFSGARSRSSVFLSLLGSKKKIESAEDVCRLLEPWTTATVNVDTVGESSAKMAAAMAAEVSDMKDDKIAPPNFLWGSLPVGPVLSSRLYASGRTSPTSVQCAAFPILTAAAPSSSQENIISNGVRRGNGGENASSKYHGSKRKTTIKAKIKRSNGIIASPTGTGKTLAYLLPLLCTSPGGQIGEGIGGILIVTPTIELACQIQREVDLLWPPLQKEVDGNSCQLSSLLVVGDVTDDDGGTAMHDHGGTNDLNGDSLLEGGHRKANESLDNFKVGISPGRMILRSIERNAPTIISGTPKMLRMLYREAGRIAGSRETKYGSVDSGDDDPITEGERATSMALLQNLRAIVLDEADRLLRTEAVARETTERKNRKIEQRRMAVMEEQAVDAAVSSGAIPRPLPASKKKPRLVIARQTQAELLLRDLPIKSLDSVQLICASATVGRTMRRQLMQILNKNSADAAATLVTGNDDPRVKSKSADRRKSVLLPERLQHAYRVVEVGCDDTDNTTIEEEEEEEEEVEEEVGFSSSEKEDEFIHGNTSLLPSTNMAARNEDIRVKHAIDTLWGTMMMPEMRAKPIIIFPGRLGVDRVQQELMMRGIDDIRTLRNLDGKKGMGRPAFEDEDLSPAEERDNSNNKWKSVPIYIIGERFARGLDLPDVEYVFMLSPPSSAAGYAHMAGRTGRSGRSGMAITLVRPRNNEVQRLAAIAEALGLKFTVSMSGFVGEG